MEVAPGDQETTAPSDICGKPTCTDDVQYMRKEDVILKPLSVSVETRLDILTNSFADMHLRMEMQIRDLTASVGDTQSTLSDIQNQLPFITGLLLSSEVAARTPLAIEEETHLPLKSR